MFVTIPDIDNRPILIQTSKLKHVRILEDLTLELNFGEGDIILTNMPRQILVDMLTKENSKPIPVQPSTEWAGN